VQSKREGEREGERERGRMKANERERIEWRVGTVKKKSTTRK